MVKRQHLHHYTPTSPSIVLRSPTPPQNTDSSSSRFCRVSVIARVQAHSCTTELRTSVPIPPAWSQSQMGAMEGEGDVGPKVQRTGSRSRVEGCAASGSSAKLAG